LRAARGALETRFREALGPVDHPLGLAVSGGGDSVALLLLAVGAGLNVRAVTVDHGLREGSAAEAAWVGALCARLGVGHEVLRWEGWGGAGNLQDAARRARLRLIGEWAGARGIGAVALGHTRDDQAETVLMRLVRQAGVDGLSGMAARRMHGGVAWLRPLLGVGRGELRDWLRARGQDWIEDPSNEALRFDRVKARRMLERLAPLGLDAAALAGVADRMAEARAALAAQTLEAARRLARIEAGDVAIGREGFAALPAEIRRRLLVAALVWVGSADYGPRAAPLQALLASIVAGRGGTLAGGRVLVRRDEVRITREARAVAETVAAPGQLWDGRWRVTGPGSGAPATGEPEINPLEVRALGEAGLAACPDWRRRGVPRASLLASPAVWRAGVLIAAPLARDEPEWQAATEGGPLRFFDTILSH
jgi:tRNA(Ile)-lysidine synthase